MTNLDHAAETFEEIAAEYGEVGASDEREAEARMRFIDRVLFECLEWPRSAMLELTTVQNDASDYVLRDMEEKNWAIVEAKRPSVLLANPDGPGKAGTAKFKLGGPAFNFGKNQGAWPIFATQVSKYAVAHGTSIAIVTNGPQWVAAALPSRSGQPLAQDHGIVFADIDAIRTQFERFYNFFSLSGVRSRYLEQFLADQGVWAVVAQRRPSFIVSPGEVQPILPESENDEFHRALDRALTIAFSPVEDDPDLLEKCFVETRFSQHADDRLMRLTEHLTMQLSRQLEAYEDAVRERAEEVFDLALRSQGHLVLLSGQKSAGKTTYLRRFFGRTLKTSERQKVRYVHVRFDRGTDLRDADDIHRVIAQTLETEVFSAEGTVSQGQFYDLYRTEWTTHTGLYGDDNESRREFVREHRQRQERHPLDYAERLIKHTAHRHRRLPCLAFDGWDHLAPHLQAAVLQASTTLFLNTFAVITVVADDTTLWKARNEGLDQLFSDYVTDRYWLPRPKIGEVLDNRLDYLQEVFSRYHKEHYQPAKTHIGKSSIRWKFDPDKVSAFLRDSVLFGHDDVRVWIGELANHDLRKVLDLIKRLILSPALKKEPIFTAFVSGDKEKLSRGRLLSTIIRPNLNWFREDPSHVVFNILDHRVENTFSPMAPALLLALLDEKQAQDIESGHAIQGFLSVRDLLDWTEEHLRIPEQHSLNVIRWLASIAMIEPYDPSATDPTSPQQRVKILPRGSLHLRWALHEWGYLREMAFTHPIVDDDAFQEIQTAFEPFKRHLESTNYGQQVSHAAPVFARYLLDHLRLDEAAADVRTRPAVEFVEAFQKRWFNA